MNQILFTGNNKNNNNKSNNNLNNNNTKNNYNSANYSQNEDINDYNAQFDDNRESNLDNNYNNDYANTNINENNQFNDMNMNNQNDISSDRNDYNASQQMPNSVMNSNVNSYGKQSKNSGMKGIIIVFAIIICIFGIGLVGIGISSIISENKQNSSKNSIPDVAVSQEDGKIKITVKHDKSISKIIYNWNNEEKVEINGSGRTEIDEFIDMPQGNNVLNITVIDINNKEVNYSKEYQYQEQNTNGPEIELLVESGEAKIVARDDSKMKSIKYQWDGGEQKEVPVSESDPTKIETRIEILKGEHTLKITAMDVDGNESTKEQIFKGANKPKIELLQDGSNLLITLKDDDGISKVEYTLNGNPVTIEGNKEKEIKRTEALISGRNQIDIKVTNVNQLQESISGYCDNNN